MSVHTHLEPEIIGALSSLLTPGADIRPLPSERDLNYRVVSGTESVVLKVHAPGDQDWLELQDRALRQIRDIDVSTPHPLHPQIVRLADGRCVRLVNWVDGAPWATSELTIDHSRSLGRAVALVDRGLAGMRLTEPTEEPRVAALRDALDAAARAWWQDRLADGVPDPMGYRPLEPEKAQ